MRLGDEKLMQDKPIAMGGDEIGALMGRCLGDWKEHYWRVH